MYLLTTRQESPPCFSIFRELIFCRDDVIGFLMQTSRAVEECQPWF